MLKYLFAKPAVHSSDQRWLDVPDGAGAGAEVFTYHRESAGRALLGGLFMAAMVEAITIHFLISMWNHWVAWAATLASVWFALQVVAQIRAIGMRPIYVYQGRLVVRNGAFDLFDISISQIATIEKSMNEVKTDDGQLQPLNVGFPMSHNVVLRLKEPTQGKILNRKTRDFQIALLAIDDPDRFIKTIHEHML